MTRSNAVGSGCVRLLYSRKLSKFWALVAIHMSFSVKLGVWHLLAAPASVSQKFFYKNKNLIFHKFAKFFSLKSFPLYGITTWNDVMWSMEWCHVINGTMSCDQCVPASTAIYVSMRQKIASKEVAPPINDKSSLKRSPIGTKPAWAN